VHYVSYGTPGGEYRSVCRTALVTEVPTDGPTMLAVINPTGLFFHDAAHDSGAGQPGDPDCAMKGMHGVPMRYCPCGWTEPSLRGGTWHWASECLT
jgi:hypothetical protein